MNAAMPKSVQLTIPPLSEKEREERVKQLRIPKRRQKELLAMVQEAWEKIGKFADDPMNSAVSEESRKSAPAA